MKATGIVRRIDDLGRVVIPREIRRALRMRDGDPLELFIDGESVVLKKYSPIGELSDFAKEYADSLSNSLEHVICISDMETVIAVAGGSKRELLDKRINADIQKEIDSKHTVAFPGLRDIVDDNICDVRMKGVIAPIIAAGDPVGAVMILSKSENVAMGELEVKLAETAASFLGKQMEM